MSKRTRKKEPTHPLNQSVEFEFLCCLTEKRGSLELVEDLREFLFYLNAPSNLEKFIYLCLHRLLPILELREQLTEEFKKSITLDESLLDGSYRWICWFKNNIDHFSDHLLYKKLAIIEPEHIGMNPLFGWGIQRFELYGALFQQPKDDENHTQWRMFALLLWIAQAQILRDEDNQSEYEAYLDKRPFIIKHKIYAASHALRQISDDNYVFELEKYASSIKIIALFSENLTPGIESPLITYLSHAFGVTSWKDHNHGKGNKRHYTTREKLPAGYVNLSDGVLLVTEEPDIDDPYLPFRKKTKVHIDVEPPEDVPITGIEPGELSGGEELTLHSTDCTKSAHDIMSHILALRRQEVQHRMRHQLLPWSYEQLSLGEICDFILYLRETITDMSKRALSSHISTQSQNIWERALLSLVILVTGSSLQRALNLSILKQGAKTSDAELFLYQHDNKQSRIHFEWGVKAFEPIYNSNDTYDPQKRKTKVGSFYLPDLLNVGPLIIHYRNYLKQQPRKRRLTSKIFYRNLSEYKKGLKLFLKNCPPSISDRITLAKIQHFTLNQMISEIGDVTAASSVTGHEHELAGTRIHYTTLSIDYLRSSYTQAFTPILKNMGECIEPDEIEKTKTPVYIGARHCLKKEGVKQAIKAISDDMRVAKMGRSDTPFIEFHNLLTAYTTLLFQFGTAGRSIINPLIPTSQINSDTMLTTYRDKDFDVPYHARLLWIPPLVYQQLRLYESHLSAIRAEVEIYTTQTINRELNGFFLTQNMKPSAIRPKTMTEHFFNPYLRAPDNSPRRYIRSELIESGYSIESTDAMMGHWFSGEEPWSKVSTFNFAIHRRLLQQKITTLLDELGFKIIKSPLIRGHSVAR